MFTHIYGAALHGIEGQLIKVEADISKGFPSYMMVGYLASEVREARERVTTALKNAGIGPPTGRIVINLSPAGVRKQGTAFDLPIAVALMAAMGMINYERARETLFIGELGLDGGIRPVPGVLPMICCAAKEGISQCVVAKANAMEASAVDGMKVMGVEHIKEVISWLRGRQDMSAEVYQSIIETNQSCGDYSEIYGQELLKGAIVTAVAGKHHLLMLGSPGCGKTMAASRIPSIMPDMSKEESIEVTKIYSAAGMLKAGGLMVKRPFRQPHHWVTTGAIIGGGQIPVPGEVSLAHLGVLFLDEFAECRRQTLEALREPLESGRTMISRVQATYEFPSDFMLVAAMNPCPCGHYPDRQRCRCSTSEIRRYFNKVSQPILDRIDMAIEVVPVAVKEIKHYTKGRTSKDMKRAVEGAWDIQKERYKNQEYSFNSRLPAGDLNKYCTLTKDGKDMLWEAYDCHTFSARGYHKLLRVARTVADLEFSTHIDLPHLLEALSYKGIDEKYWTVEESL